MNFHESDEDLKPFYAEEFLDVSQKALQGDWTTQISASLADKDIKRMQMVGYIVSILGKASALVSTDPRFVYFKQKIVQWQVPASAVKAHGLSNSL